jgi:hypothetical protein
MDVDVDEARAGDEAAPVDRPRPLAVGGAEREAAIRPSRTKRSPTESRREAGSMTRAFGLSRVRAWAGLFGGGDHVLGLVARAQVEDGHADGDPVGDLLEDHAALAVGQLAVDLDAAVDRAGCMMMAPGLSQEARVLLRPNMLVYSPSEGKCWWPWRSCWMRRSMTTSASAGPT